MTEPSSSGSPSGLYGSCLKSLALRLSGPDQRPPVELQDLLIRTKDRRLLPFEPNEVQRRYMEQIAPGWPQTLAALKGRRELILKARQFGFSTLIGALFFLDTINTPNTVSVVISADSDATKKLFRMVQTFYRNLPDHKRPATQYANRNEYFWPDLNSSYYVGTAGDRSFGRGDTINNLHCSEVAFYPDAETLMTGLLQAVPAEGSVFMETTANGLGDFFYREFWKAERGESRYTARFHAWWEHPEYAWEPSGEAELLEAERLADGLGEEERDAERQIRAAYALSEAQLQWRRRKMAEPGMRAKFVQEYPANAREAFIASGDPYFNRQKLQSRLEHLQAHPPSLHPAPGPLRSLEVFRLPERGREYVIGADTAEGLRMSGDHDYDSADVFDARSWEQVAHLHGKWDTHDFGLMLAELGWFYNCALLAIERNNHGHAVINAALHSAGYPPMSDRYPGGLYYHADYDDPKQMETRRPGWPTTAKSKSFALDALATAIDEGDVTINSLGTLAELLRYVKLPGGRSGGASGSHDDRVISAAIGLAVLKLRPQPRPFDVAVGGKPWG